MAALLICILYLYRWMISPYLKPRCRFEPTCSRYAIHCLQHHGLQKGGWLIFKRLLKCHPFYKRKMNWVYDPIPENRSRIIIK